MSTESYSGERTDEESAAHGEIDSDVLGTRTWLEEIIMAHGICPPLIKVTKPYVDAEGKIDWDAAESKIKLVSYRHFDPSSERLVTQVATDYRQSIEGVAAVAEGVPLTILDILLISHLILSILPLIRR